MGGMPLLLAHRDIIYEDDAILLPGHAYFNCVFRRCTIHARDGQTYLEKCSFENCVWHFDSIVSNADQIQALRQLLEFAESSVVQEPAPPPGETEPKS